MGERSAAVNIPLTIRRLMRRLTRGALGTLLGQAPYVSLVMVALDLDGSPLLLLSDLADHTRNLKADGRASLLFDGTLDAAMPLAAERVTVQGSVALVRDERLLARYVARHPDALTYLGFSDFNLYRMSVERAHLVAGFGRIHWVEARDILLPTASVEPLAAGAADIVAHMNQDHSDAVGLYANMLLGLPGDGWTMTGLDPDGCDLRSSSRTARLDFDRQVDTPESARLELVQLAKRARGQMAASGARG